MERPDPRIFPPPSLGGATLEANRKDWDRVAEASWESFPASDPPSWISRERERNSLSFNDSLSAMHDAKRIDIDEGGFVVDSALLAELFDLRHSGVRRLMHGGKIAGICEKGVGEHRDQFRLTFFHGSRRARICVDAIGHILEQSVIYLEKVRAR